MFNPIDTSNSKNIYKDLHMSSDDVEQRNTRITENHVQPYRHQQL